MKAAEQTLTMTCRVRFDRGAKGKLEMKSGGAALATVPTGRVPRIARLMALAIRFDDLLKRGEVKDYAELARLGHVSRARVSQIMNLLMLAPNIQESILLLPLVESGHDLIKEWQVRRIVREPNWSRQRQHILSLRLAR